MGAPAQVEVADERAGAKVEVVLHDLRQLGVRLAADTKGKGKGKGKGEVKVIGKVKENGKGKGKGMGKVEARQGR